TARPSLRSRTPGRPAADGQVRTYRRIRTSRSGQDFEWERNAPGAGSVDVGNGDEGEIGCRGPGRDDGVPPPTGFALGEVVAEMRAAALPAPERGLGNQSTDEQQIAGLDSAARHGTARP